MNKKQVMDIRPNSDYISQAESNEQQRNWSEDFLWKKSNDPMANYDPKRTHLNFEVARGGIVQPIDKSKSIMQKMTDNLAARGIKDPNARENVHRRQNTLAQFIFGGSRERMNELAFGNQTLNLDKGADNSHLTRNNDIEEWAKDVYAFVAHRFGEENIVSFYVHLDETNVHAHCTLIPLDQKKNRISWRSVFGQNRYEMGQLFSQLHDEFSKEVSMKWGLERGDSIRETGARHRSTYEYKRELVNDVNHLESRKIGLAADIRQEERKLKSLTTMMANLRERRASIQREIDEIARSLGEEGTDNILLTARIKSLRQEMEDIDSKIAERSKMLEETSVSLKNIREELFDMKREHQRALEREGDDIDREATHVRMGITSTYNMMLAKTMQEIIPTLNDRQRDILREKGYYDLAENAQNIANCAMLLVLNYVKLATSYAESCGGGGVSNLSEWGQKKDEDDVQWWVRCIATAAAMVKPRGKKRTAGVGR